MVMDRPKDGKLQELDWQILGHDYIKDGKPTLPVRRLFVPMPSNKDGLHLLAAKFAKLSHDITERARLPYPERSAIGEVMGLVAFLAKEFNQTKKAWEHELQVEAEKANDSSEPTPIKLRTGSLNS